MLNEDAYKDAREDLNRLACPFEKAILRGCCGCELSQKNYIAERELIACKSAVARENCRTLRGLLHQNALFTLKLTHLSDLLPHAKDMKLQCGGMIGLQRIFATDPAPQTTVSNIHGLVLAAQEKFGNLENLPYSEIVISIAHYESRRRPS